MQYELKLIQAAVDTGTRPKSFQHDSAQLKVPIVNYSMALYKVHSDHELTIRPTQSDHNQRVGIVWLGRLYTASIFLMHVHIRCKVANGIDLWPTWRHPQRQGVKIFDHRILPFYP